MDTQLIIDNLQNSDLYAECPCGAEFKLSDLILFDGTKPFPPEVEEAQERYLQMLLDRGAQLEKDLKLATEATRARIKLNSQKIVINDTYERKKSVIFSINPNIAPGNGYSKWFNTRGLS